MSLNWDISKTEAWRKHKEEGAVDPRYAESLVYACMALDMQGITEKNIDEFWFRLLFLRNIDRPFWTREGSVKLSKLKEWMDTKPQSYADISKLVKAFNRKFITTRLLKDWHITYEELRDYIGLSTNVAQRTRKQWINKMMRFIEQEVMKEVNSTVKEANNATA